MELSERSGNIIKSLEPHVEFITELPRTVHNCLIGLYKDMSVASKYVLKLRKNNQILSNLVPIQLNSKDLNVNYFPDEIQKHIKMNVKHMLIFKTNIGKREIVIEFGISEEQLGDLEKYESHVNYILQWLHICGVYSKDTCAKSINIKIFMTCFKKILPKKQYDILDPININTGYSNYCSDKGEIVIYREEEWKKVFIHETFHAYGLDFGINSFELISRMKKLFPVNSEHNVSEAYTETWARICNSAMCAYLCISGKRTVDKYMQAVIFNIGIERMYASIQAEKVLKHMGLEYDSLIGEGETNKILRLNLYRENTNVLAYYVITAILLYDYPEFILWCNKYNTTLLRFRSTETNFKLFADMIETTATSRKFLKFMKDMSKIKIKNMKTSLTMSAIGSCDL